MFDISKIIVKAGEGHTKKLMINDTLGIMLKYPSFSMMRSMDNIEAINQQQSIAEANKIDVPSKRRNILRSNS